MFIEKDEFSSDLHSKSTKRRGDCRRLIEIDREWSWRQDKLEPHEPNPSSHTLPSPSELPFKASRSITA